MKSDFTSFTISSNEEKEEEIIDNLSFYVADSAKTILSIKESVYELVSINLNMSSPRRKIDNMASIVSGSRKNLDDLKRLDSMLKGYLNSRRDYSNDNQNELIN